MKVHYLRLLVENFDACYDFYSEKLGFEVTWGEKGEAYASFQVNESMMLSLFKKELMYEHLNMKLASTSPSFVIAIQSESVDEDYKKLMNRGIQFINEPHDVPGWGDRCVHLKDPEGNILEINQTLQSDLWDDDLKSHKDAEKILKNL